MASVAVNCTEDIITKLKTVSALGDKVFPVYEEQDLVNQSKLLSPPFAGVYYEGIIPAPGDTTSRQGLTTDIRISVALGMAPRTVANLDSKVSALDLLEEMRSPILTKTSPTGHKWRFLMEIPMGMVGNVYIYIQRWSTMFPNTPR